ncbi:tyrosine-type recombinase/integrase [Oleiharenicola lentus]|uniref:tyrosine-type recombinase/integrase n=1 Tax=Oleiharenicola lentus TaxID=2508720 RepID=UPI003F66F50A
MLRADTPTDLDWERLNQHLPCCDPRDRALIELGVQTGLRLSELLALRIQDVWRNGTPLPVLRVSRRNLKGGRGCRARLVSSRTIPLNVRARNALAAHLGPTIRSPVSPLFPSRNAAGLQPLCRQQAVRIIKKIFLNAGLDPHRVWSGHSLRKRFVRGIFDQTGSINIARQAVGHRWITTTQLYLGLDEEEAQLAIEKLGELRHSGDAAIKVSLSSGGIIAS